MSDDNIAVIFLASIFVLGILVGGTFFNQRLMDYSSVAEQLCEANNLTLYNYTIDDGKFGKIQCQPKKIIEEKPVVDGLIVLVGGDN